MPSSNSTKSPLELTARKTSAKMTSAFKQLGNETRLAILLALWENYDRFDEDSPITFSELYDQVSIPDSGNFTYHLDKLTGHFVEETDDGYELRNAGLRIVQAVIAGTGLGDREVAPTEIDMSCFLCGSPVEVSYDDERLYVACTDCGGLYGPSSSLPAGTLIAKTFDPAGLVERSPGELLAVGSVRMFKGLEQMIRGFCPECTGPVEPSPRICEDHDPTTREVCSTCGTRDQVQVRYVCSVCKHTGVFSAQAAIHGHPSIAAFCHEHGIDRMFDMDDPEACGRFWAHLYDREYSLESTDPIRIRITVPADTETLELTFNGDLDITDESRIEN